MSTIPAFDYALLWRERSLRSVANMSILRGTVVENLSEQPSWNKNGRFRFQGQNEAITRSNVHLRLGIAYSQPQLSSVNVVLEAIDTDLFKDAAECANRG